jgi:hypothetical protein
MKKETLYLDTSVISAYYDARAKERRDATINFWQNVAHNYKVFISEITVSELEDTKDETLKINFRKLITDIKVLRQMFTLIEVFSQGNTLLMPFMLQ